LNQCSAHIAKGATQAAIREYDAMLADPAIQSPLSWSENDFSLDRFDLVFLPGGHESGVRQVIDNDKVHALLADYFPKTRKPSKKSIAAICHGVMVLSETCSPDGKSVLHDATTTALPGFMEGFAYWSTKPLLGAYYKTYGAGSDSVETSVCL
jgi:putative intracellular protease/amidase